MAKMVIRIVGRGRIRHVPWPKSYINVETGDYVTDISKITQTVKWQPSVGLEEGISRTVTYYKRFGKHYF
jgi:nucleoside-diphosphate-sugar epimerase